jgi:hypothetical protein
MKAMARQRSHSIEFKRQVAQEFIAGESLYALSKRHDISRQLIRQVTATYDSPGFMVALVFSPRGESNENSTRGTSWFNGSRLGSLPGVNRLVR